MYDVKYFKMTTSVEQLGKKLSIERNFQLTWKETLKFERSIKIEKLNLYLENNAALLMRVIGRVGTNF